MLVKLWYLISEAYPLFFRELLLRCAGTYYHQSNLSGDSLLRNSMLLFWPSRCSVHSSGRLSQLRADHTLHSLYKLGRYL